MKVSAAVLTYRTVSTGRLEMLKDTLRSLGEADSVYLYDNGSDDGSTAILGAFNAVLNKTPLTTSGHGTNMCARILAATDADICVLSDDDMIWREGWRETLESWWSNAIEEVWLTGGHLEPEYPWNETHGVVEFGGVRGLLRDSTGAASWTYRRSMTDQIFPIPQQVQGWGDVPACDRIDELGGKVAQIDVAEHAGHGQSTWGNKTAAKYGHDLAPVKAMVA